MTALSILLPPVTYGLLVLILARKGSIEERLNSLAKSHVIFFTFVAVSTEILSAFRWIDFPHLLCAWGLLCLSGALAVAFMNRWRDMGLSWEAFHGISRLSILLSAAIAFILATTLAAAILYPPNNWDSMTYHMARVANWISHGSVHFYPTAIGRQNYPMPLAEFAIMHLQILSGSDLFANLVQWICFFVSIVLGALIAAELGLSKTGQLISSAIIATIPMAILQSSNTQNDLVVSSFILSFALFMLRLRKDFAPANIVFASLSLGLALLTKGTAFIYCAALGVSLAIPILLKAGENGFVPTCRRAGALSLVVLMALIICSGHFARDYRLYGAPIASGEESYWNQKLTTPSLLSNIARNLALHCGTPSGEVNWYVYRAFRRTLGKQLNNPDTTWPAASFMIPYYRRHEDFAGNPIHLLMTLLALASLSLGVWRKQQRYTNGYVVGVLLAGVLYCACLRWQPWASRLHTPLFALSAPVIALGLAAYAKGAFRYVAWAAIALMFVFSVPFALNNQMRSLLSYGSRRQSERVELYFTSRPILYESYRTAMHMVASAGAQDVGLYLGHDDYEYPLWVLAKEGSRRSDIRFHHVGVNDQSRILQTAPYLPAYVIATKTTDAWDQNNRYSLVYADKNVRVLKRLGDGP